VKDSMTFHKNSNVSQTALKVSIITPVYNAGIYIEEFLQSLQNQTYKNWEVLFLNNYSKDDTAKIIKKYAINSNPLLDNIPPPILDNIPWGINRDRGGGIIKSLFHFG